MIEISENYWELLDCRLEQGGHLWRMRYLELESVGQCKFTNLE